MRNDRENVIVDLSFNFALDIIDFSEIFYEEKRYPLANQIFKAGTSIGANVREAQNAESLADFIHKMKISAKEVDEVDYWLALCKYSDKLHSPEKNMLEKLKSIELILSKIISSSKKKLG